MILVLALSPSLDVTYEVSSLAVNGITRPASVTRVAGGKALNMARVAAALGSEVHAVVPLGGHTGAWIDEMLAGDGVTTDIVPSAAPTRTCLAIVEDGDAPESTDVYERAAPVSAYEWRGIRSAVELALESHRPAYLVLSGSIPDGVVVEELVELLMEARRMGARVVIDGSGAGLRACVVAADLIKINRSEAAELLGVEAAALPDGTTACRELRARYAVDSVVTDGIRGAAASGVEFTGTVAAPRRRGRFSAGSGDAFLGGLVAALDRGLGWADALSAAADAAERNALVPGQGRLL